MANRLQVALFASLCALLCLAPHGVWGTGVCGTGAAVDFPTQCYFNSDPAGRYVCCDSQGCDGFNPDGVIPHCKNFGYVPPSFGVPGRKCPGQLTSTCVGPGVALMFGLQKLLQFESLGGGLSGQMLRDI